MADPLHDAARAIRTRDRVHPAAEKGYMTKQNESGGLFQAPNRKHIDEHSRPVVDGSDEARRRRRHPFDVEETDAPAPRPDEPSGNTQA